MTRRAFITGIAGQDGSYLAELLIGKGYRVIGSVPPGGARTLANLATIRERVSLIELDLGDPRAIAACLREHRPDELYNLAAMSFSPDCWDSPHKAGEVLGLRVVNLLDAVRSECPECRCFQAGSSEMFGSDAPAPQSERTPFWPTSPYGAAKNYAHFMARIYRDRFGLFVTNGLLFPHESPRRDPRFLTRKVTAQLARIVRSGERELHLGGLDSRRDWTFAGDMARGMWLALQATAPDDFVFASGATHSVRDFCQAAFSHVGLDYREHVRLDAKLVRVESGMMVGDPSKAHAELNWRPAVGFEQLVHMMVEADLAALPPTDSMESR